MPLNFAFIFFFVSIRLKANVGQNFDTTNPRIPTSLCSGCRLENFSAKAIAESKSFSIPQYLQFVVVPENVDAPCDCSICFKVKKGDRGKSNLLQGKKSTHAGGRPVSSPDIPKKQPKSSPISLCGLCLVPKGPDHNSKRCNEITKTKNIITLTHDEEGKPNKTGEKVASKVVKGMEPSPNGTIRLSLQGTGKKVTCHKRFCPAKSTKYENQG